MPQKHYIFLYQAILFVINHTYGLLSTCLYNLASPRVVCSREPTLFQPQQFFHITFGALQSATAKFPLLLLRLSVTNFFLRRFFFPAMINNVFHITSSASGLNIFWQTGSRLGASTQTVAAPSFPGHRASLRPVRLRRWHRHTTPGPCTRFQCKHDLGDAGGGISGQEPGGPSPSPTIPGIRAAAAVGVFLGLPGADQAFAPGFITCCRKFRSATAQVADAVERS